MTVLFDNGASRWGTNDREAAVSTFLFVVVVFAIALLLSFTVFDDEDD